MGGRGRDSGIINKQRSIEEYEKRLKIQAIIKEGEVYRNSVLSGSKISGSIPRLYKKCACCNQYTIPIEEKYYICEVCGWIDDEYQNMHPESSNGRNVMSLKEAKRQYFENR